jgi:hypothetical protein
VPTGCRDCWGGLRATTIENGFPPFAEKRRYLLFLNETTEPNTYVVIAGGSGAFEAGDEIAPMLSVPGAALAPCRASRSSVK